MMHVHISYHYLFQLFYLWLSPSRQSVVVTSSQFKIWNWRIPPPLSDGVLADLGVSGENRPGVCRDMISHRPKWGEIGSFLQQFYQNDRKFHGQTLNSFSWNLVVYGCDLFYVSYLTSIQLSILNLVKRKSYQISGSMGSKRSSKSSKNAGGPYEGNRSTSILVLLDAQNNQYKSEDPSHSSTHLSIDPSIHMFISHTPTLPANTAESLRLVLVRSGCLNSWVKYWPHWGLIGNIAHI